MTHLLASLAIVIALWISPVSSAQAGTPPPKATEQKQAPSFNEAHYQNPELLVSQKTYSHAGLRITLIQVKRIEGFEKGTSFLAQPNEPPIYCRAWLTVHKANRLLAENYYADIHPLGSAYGLFVPQSQPSQDYFAVVKFGDYAGQLLLVHKDGTISDHLGGPFFITPDRRFLFSNYSSDDSGLTVFDLKKDKAIFSSIIEPYIQDWYQSKLGYFFTESDFDSQWPYKGKKGVIHLFDFSKKRIISKSMNLSDVKDAKKIDYDFPYPRFDKDKSPPYCISQ